ncbi:MAG TPA: hypothetical protein PKD73_16995 [Burkholderiaceae bacterium]|jgi:hypothetical protein|nr:hypothetical protein [Burkholderiaceae bacterium]
MKTPHIALAACLAAACSLTQAATAIWNGTPQDLVWYGDERCRLQVTAVTQTRPYDPITVTVANRGAVRVKYSIYVFAERLAGEPVFFDTFTIASAASGAVSVGKTRAWSNSIIGAKIKLSVDACSVIG